jgi:hypothetical protein
MKSILLELTSRKSTISYGLLSLEVPEEDLLPSVILSREEETGETEKTTSTILLPKCFDPI